MIQLFYATIDFANIQIILAPLLKEELNMELFYSLSSNVHNKEDILAQEAICDLIRLSMKVYNEPIFFKAEHLNADTFVIKGLIYSNCEIFIASSEKALPPGWKIINTKRSGNYFISSLIKDDKGRAHICLFPTPA